MKTASVKREFTFTMPSMAVIWMQVPIFRRRESSMSGGSEGGRWIGFRWEDLKKIFKPKTKALRLLQLLLQRRRERCVFLDQKVMTSIHMEQSLLGLILTWVIFWAQKAMTLFIWA